METNGSIRSMSFRKTWGCGQYIWLERRREERGGEIAEQKEALQKGMQREIYCASISDEKSVGRIHNARRVPLDQRRKNEVDFPTVW